MFFKDQGYNQSW